MKTKLQQNIIALQQGEALLQKINAEAYSAIEKFVFQSTIGTHIRHNLDHYYCFLSGINTGHIDYSERARDIRIEEDRDYALTEITRVRKALKKLESAGEYPHLCIECDLESGLALSSVQRELEFLLSHTIHHYAIIAIICRLQGITVEDGFGIAPSTLHYREEQRLRCVH